MNRLHLKCIYCGVKMKDIHKPLCPYVTPNTKMREGLIQQNRLLAAALGRIRELEEQLAPKDEAA
jgi:hypothetical protein